MNEGGAAKSSANWITGDIAAFIKSNRFNDNSIIRTNMFLNLNLII